MHDRLGVFSLFSYLLLSCTQSCLSRLCLFRLSYWQCSLQHSFRKSKSGNRYSSAGLLPLQERHKLSHFNAESTKLTVDKKLGYVSAETYHKNFIRSCIKVTAPLSAGKDLTLSDCIIPSAWRERAVCSSKTRLSTSLTDSRVHAGYNIAVGMTVALGSFNYGYEMIL